MKSLLIILLIFFVTYCTEKRDKSKQVYYFSNEIGHFRKSQTKNGIAYSMIQGWNRIEDDFGVIPRKEPCIYSLNYFNGDRTFEKQKSYLDSIRYYNLYWVLNDSNLQDFWTKKSTDLPVVMIL